VEVPRRSWYRRCGGVLLAANLVGAVVLPTSTRARPEPGVLWQQGGGPGRWVGGSQPRPLAGPLVLQLPELARYGGGNFKLSGAGAFAGVSVQRVGVRGRGVLRVTGGGRAA
jgi:hypothetical protein